MKNMKRILLTVVAAMLLVVMSVAGTLAYLTSETEVVTNTFTVGKVEISLDEARVNLYGEPTKEVKVTNEDGSVTTTYEVVEKNEADRVMENTYKLVPGHNYVKDPTVYIADDSEPCWLFVKVTNEIADIEQGYDAVSALTIKEQMVGDPTDPTGGMWTEVADNIYAYEVVVNPGDKIVVFNNFYLKSDANVAAYAGKTITVQAYAIQADTLDTYTDAWTANDSTWPAN